MAESNEMYAMPGQLLNDIGLAVKTKLDDMTDIPIEDIPMKIGLIDGGGNVGHIHGTKDTYGGTYGYFTVEIPEENYDHYLATFKTIGYWYKDADGSWAYQDGIVFSDTGINDLNIPFGGQMVYPMQRTEAYTNASGKSVSAKNHIGGYTIMVQTTGSVVLINNISAPTITTESGKKVLKQTLRKGLSATNTSPHYGTRIEYDLYYWND